MDQQSAKNIEDILSNKYKENIRITNPTRRPLMLKITRIQTDLQLTEDIKSQIMEQNKWTRDLLFKLEKIQLHLLIWKHKGKC